jgi:phosphatidate phosphatase APP1
MSAPTPPAPFLLVTDFDDTLKISHTTNRLRTVFRGLFARQAYAGMSELFQEWNGGQPFIVISSSPTVIFRKITRFLDRHGFPEREIWLRDWFKQKDIRRFKSDALRRLEARPEAGFIFIGDDSEYDPEVFAAFRERNPGRTLAIYIRKMRGRPLPDGVQGFHSALEIALAELEAGRMKIPQVSRIGKAIIDQGDADHIIPYFASSPADIAVTEKFPTLEKLIDLLNLRYAKIRKDRKPR